MTAPVIDGIGLNLTSLPDGRLDLLPAMLDAWKAAGCSHVEVTARRLDLVVGGRLNLRRTEAVAEMVAASGLKPVLHANHAIDLMNPRNAEVHRAAAAASVEVCARLGASSMVIHSGRVPADLWAEKADDLLAGERDGLRRLGDAAGRIGLRIAVENMTPPKGPESHAYGAFPARLAEQLERTDHPQVGACLDFGHAFLSATALGFPYIDDLATLSPFVWHLHLHDNCGRPGEAGDEGDRQTLGIGDMHCPMFLGTIPWTELLPRMRFRERTFGGIELNGRYNADAATVVATAHAIAAHLNDGAPLVNPYPES